MRRVLLLVLWPRVASGACTTEKKYQLGTSTGTSTSEISTAAIGKGRGREKAGNRTRRLEALWPAIAGPGKVCTPGDTVNGKFNPALNLKRDRSACQEWAVSRGRSVYVWGTNNGCQSCGTTNTRDGWEGYSVYQKGDNPGSCADGLCYTLYAGETSSGGISSAAAEEQCVVRGGHLAKISTAAQMALVDTITDVVPRVSVRVGAVKEGGFWRWGDGTAVTIEVYENDGDQYCSCTNDRGSLNDAACHEGWGYGDSYLCSTVGKNC